MSMQAVFRTLSSLDVSPLEAVETFLLIILVTILGTIIGVIVAIIKGILAIIDGVFAIIDGIVAIIARTPPTALTSLHLTFTISCVMSLCAIINIAVIEWLYSRPLSYKNMVLVFLAWELVSILICQGVCVFFFGREILNSGRAVQVFEDMSEEIPRVFLKMMRVIRLLQG
ncbi:hypothetical protein HD806DRAFT_524661 [Xylariaceae sp. AK1471]|nr:hypothetical protein HD806DRAFT_524661 [Xylariaceae sp. AK1471]